jgi:uncharacterized protein involved in outer membrane biogenesis
MITGWREMITTRRGGFTMKKWILIALSLVIVIIIIFLVAGLSNLGPLIKNAVNTYGPKITKTEVRLGDVGISLLSAELKLKDFYLGNPKGFTSPYALQVESIYLDAQEGSLTGKTIVIDKVELVRPDIVYEKVRGRDNFQKILNNMKAGGRNTPSSGKQSGEEGRGKKIVINEFIIRDAEVKLAMSMTGNKDIKAKATVPTIHLRDIGKKEGGITPTAAFQQVLTALYGTITSPSVLNLLSEEIKSQGVDIEGLTGGATKDLKGTTNKIKGLFGK